MSKIKELRLKRGLTQEQLAKHLGVTRVAVVYWEQEKQSPRTRYLKPLAQILRCKVVDLL